MKKWLTAIGIGVLLLAGCGDRSTVTEENETQVAGSNETMQEDYRIIAGSVVVAKILDQLNIDAVAVPDTAKELPSRFDGLPDIGNAMDPDPEVIKALNPTEVISVSTLEADLKDPFEKMKIPYDFLDLTSVESMMQEITNLGERYNRVEEAKALNAKLQADLDEVKDIAANYEGEKPKVLILLGVPGSYLVATEHSYAGDLVRLAGGENVMAGQEAEYLASNTEYLYDAKPDIIIRLAHGMPDEVVEMFNEEFKTNDVWKHFEAVKNGRVYDLEEELFGTTASLDMPKALTQLVELFYQQ